MNCEHCRTELHAEDLPTAPLCDLCHAAQEPAHHHTMAADQREEQEPGPHAEVTPAGLNFLLPGVEPIHTQQQGEGQQRLL